MTPSLSLASLCFVTCHGGSADHMAVYADVLQKQGYPIQIHAAGPAVNKFQDRQVAVDHPFSLEGLGTEGEQRLAEEIAEKCSHASVVLTDVGHAFDAKVQRALAGKKVHRLAYYDNPEPFVPGGYSATAAEVMLAAEGVVFANENLAHGKIFSHTGREVDLAGKKLAGVGYYPLEQADKVARMRDAGHAAMRAQFFSKQGIVEEGQKVLVYFGGNNEEYFGKAFPAFLSIVAEAAQTAAFGDLVIVLQQHPGAKGRNIDGVQAAAWNERYASQAGVPKVIISDFSSDEAQVLADGAFYYQTSMSPQFVLEGIPTVQIGHEKYDDVLVRNGVIPSVTCAQGFVREVERLGQPPEGSVRDSILRALGVRQDWRERLVSCMFNKTSVREN